MRSDEDRRAGRLRIEGGKNVATVVRETERKYDLDAGGSAALDAVQAMTGTAGVAACSRPGEQLLDAVYYDTADLRLMRAGVTLRRRTGGEDAGWHLKLPQARKPGTRQRRAPGTTARCQQSSRF